MKGFRKLLTFRNFLAAAGVSSTIGGGGLLVAQCSTESQDSKFGRWDYNWDKREPLSLLRRFKRRRSTDGRYYNEKIEITDEDIVKKTAKAVRHVILIRHGQYNTDGEKDSEHTLTKLGEEQAEMTGRRLAELGLKFDSIVCSDMTRAKQTAKLVLKNIGQEGLEISCEDPLLQEGPPAVPDPMLTTAEWKPDLHEFFTDGARIEAAFRKYVHRATPKQEEDSYEIIICHANVIRYMICRSLQFPGDAWLRISICHTSLNMFSILPSGRVILRTLGDGGHLPLESVTLT